MAEYDIIELAIAAFLFGAFVTGLALLAYDWWNKDGDDKE